MNAKSSEIRLRRATARDASALFALVRALGYAPTRRRFGAKLGELLRGRASEVVVASASGRVVGYAVLIECPALRLGGDVLEVDEIAVAEEARGAGVGTALMEHAFARAQARKCARVQLSTQRARESYRRGFYAKRGFVEEDAALMRRELTR